MPSKRGLHEGTIRQRGDSWQGRVMLDGRVHAVTAGSRPEVVRLLQAIATKHHEGSLNQPTLTTADWLQTWLDRGQREWKTATKERYADIIRLHLSPSLGAVELSALEPVAIRQCLGRLPVAAATRLKVYRVLHRALNVAMYDGLIASNPCAAVEPPRARRHRPTLWAAAELHSFIDSCQPGQPGALLWPVLIGTGCRLGEALALRWSAYSEGWLTIAGTLSESRSRSEVTAPKTDAAYRQVKLPVAMRAVLDKQIGAPSAPIVVTRAGHSPARRLAARWLETQCEVAGVPVIRLHDLRHLHASLLLGKNVPLAEIAGRLGHSSPAITASTYAHVIRGRSDRALAAIDEVLG